MLMDAMQLSGWTGQAVDLPINDELYVELLNEKINNSNVKKTVEDKVLDTSNSWKK